MLAQGTELRALDAAPAPTLRSVKKKGLSSFKVVLIQLTLSLFKQRAEYCQFYQNVRVSKELSIVNFIKMYE